MTVVQVTTATTLKGELETAREDMIKVILKKKKNLKNIDKNTSG